jgi:hypothetical protein
MLTWTVRAAFCAGTLMMGGADAPCQTFDVAVVKPDGRELRAGQRFVPH